MKNKRLKEYIHNDNGINQKRTKKKNENADFSHHLSFYIEIVIFASAFVFDYHYDDYDQRMVDLDRAIEDNGKKVGKHSFIQSVNQTKSNEVCLFFCFTGIVLHQTLLWLL